MNEVAIRPADPYDEAVRGLIEQLDQYQLSLYPEESNHLDSQQELTGDHVFFVGAYQGDQLQGCGGIKFLPSELPYAEVKRVIVRTEVRGQGISRKIMDALETHASRRGVDLIRLETGIYQPEAISLYLRLGYSKRERFGEYAEDPLSVFMEKKLSASTLAE